MLATSERWLYQPMHETRARRAQMLADVRSGLSRPQKELQPTWFYDERGSQLFEQITRLPEYYLTRTERGILESSASRLMQRYQPASLVELGAGSADKTRILIEAALSARDQFTYVPIDVSQTSLSNAASVLKREHPGLRVQPLVADMRSKLSLPPELPRPLLYVFLGSTIGNLTFAESVMLARRIRSALEAHDRLLLGVDLVKEPSVIEAAYNDSAGVTAEFNLNVLRVLNREIGSDFRLDGFAHRAFYDEELRRVEMHLVSREEQQVRIPAVGTVQFRCGETIRTEISTKYGRQDVDRMLQSAGLSVEEWLTDPHDWFALAVGAPDSSPSRERNL